MRPSDVLDWDDLKLILALADTGYVNYAAERLGLDPTTVPRRIRKLEKTLDVKLVERVKGGVVLAKIADELVDAAREVEGRINDALSGAKTSDEVSGVVTLSSTDFILELIAPELTQLQQRLPQLTLDLRPSNTYLSLEKRETDIAIRLSESPSVGLVGRRLSPVHTAVYGTAEAAEKDGGYTWLSWRFPKGLTANDAFIDQFDPKGRVVARVDSMITQARYVAEGIGVARLPKAYVAQRADLNALQSLGDAPSEPAWVLTHEELRNVPRIKEVLAAVVSAFQRLDDGS